MSTTDRRDDLDRYGELEVGATVRGPGPRPSAPRETGTLIGLYLLRMPRSRGYFAEVRREDGTTYTTAVGLVSPVRS